MMRWRAKSRWREPRGWLTIRPIAVRSWLSSKPGSRSSVDDRLVEPNSSLGKAIAYMQGHWETLTRFLHLPGAPIDNNLCERSLKLFIRQRKNSLFYKTEHSAYVASVLTSLIATCVQAGVNAVDYLVALQEHRHEVFLHPAAWLPWNYARRLALSDLAPVRCHSGAFGVCHSTKESTGHERTKGRCASAEVGHHVKRP